MKTNIKYKAKCIRVDVGPRKFETFYLHSFKIGNKVRYISNIPNYFGFLDNWRQQTYNHRIPFY